MSLTAARLRPDSSSAVRLEVTSVPGRFLLVGSYGVVEIDARPSLRRARAWEQSVRRIEGVELCRCAGRWTAETRVVGHRLPARRAVSLGTAIGLGLRGHCLSLCPETLADHVDGEG